MRAMLPTASHPCQVGTLDTEKLRIRYAVPNALFRPRFGLVHAQSRRTQTAWLRTLYVLVFIELGTRRIHLSPSTVHPDSA